MTTTPLLLQLAAAGANGLLTRASLDQSLKQLPARHRIGPAAFAAYSQAADLANGVAWYAVLGVGTVLLTLGAAGAGLAGQPPTAAAVALWVAVGFLAPMSGREHGGRHQPGVGDQRGGPLGSRPRPWPP